MSSNLFIKPSGKKNPHLTARVHYALLDLERVFATKAKY
jgi:hypothetical protein